MFLTANAYRIKILKCQRMTWFILNFYVQREGHYPGFSEADGEKAEGAKRHIRPGEEPARWAERSGKYEDLHAHWL